MATEIVTPAPAKSSATSWVFLLLALVLLTGGMIYGVNAYRAENEHKAADLAEEPEGTDYIEANIKISAVDANKGEMSTKIEFTPKGSFAAEDGVKLKRPLKLYINSSNGKQEYSFEAGKRMLPVDSIVDLYEGETADYPFDKHMGELVMYFEPGKEGAPKTVSLNGGPGGRASGQEDAAPPDATPGATPSPTAAPETTPPGTSNSATLNKKPAPKPLDPDDIPVYVSVYGSVSGFKIAVDKDKEADSPGYTDIEMRVSRANTALGFAVFLMVLQWALAAGVLLIAFQVLSGRRKIEFALLGYFGTLLFVFPTLRNNMPGVPPIVGTFSDFISFFWVEFLVAACLVAIIVKYLVTPPAAK